MPSFMEDVNGFKQKLWSLVLYKLIIWLDRFNLDKPDARVIYSHLIGFQALELGLIQLSLQVCRIVKSPLFIDFGAIMIFCLGLITVFV